MKKVFDWILGIVFFVSVITLLVYESIKIHKENLQIRNSLPDVNWVEEDLESVFLTTDINVYDVFEIGNDYIIYLVSVDERQQYKVLYEIKFSNFRAYWTFEKCVVY